VVSNFGDSSGLSGVVELSLGGAFRLFKFWELQQAIVRSLMCLRVGETTSNLGSRRDVDQKCTVKSSISERGPSPKKQDSPSLSGNFLISESDCTVPTHAVAREALRLSSTWLYVKLWKRGWLTPNPTLAWLQVTIPDLWWFGVRKKLSGFEINLKIKVKSSNEYFSLIFNT
jgi:hypothetical protein